MFWRICEKFSALQVGWIRPFCENFALHLPTIQYTDCTQCYYQCLKFSLSTWCFHYFSTWLQHWFVTAVWFQQLEIMPENACAIYVPQRSPWTCSLAISSFTHLKCCLCVWVYCVRHLNVKSMTSLWHEETSPVLPNYKHIKIGKKSTSDYNVVYH